MRILKTLIIFFLIFSGGNLSAEEDDTFYRAGVMAVKEKNLHAAFMNFKVFLEGNLKSKFAEGALFAVGEYYFEINDYQDASYTFSLFLKSYPHSKARIFALMYLSKIAHIRKSPELAEKMEKAVISSEQIALLFHESKKFNFRSPLLRKHLAVYFIDRIEFFIDGTPFTEIHY